MSVNFKKEETDAVGGYQIVYYYNNMRIKRVDENKPDYVAWLAEPNTPEVITFIPPTPPTFEENRTERINQVDGITGILLAPGVEYPAASGKFVHLLPHGLANPQSDYEGLDLMSSKSLLTFPYSISYIDGPAYDLVDTADWDAFFIAVAGRMSTVRSEGRDLITDLLGAVDQAALDAIVDTRT